MKITLKTTEFLLENNNPVSLRSAKNIKVTCTEGVLWITVTNQLKDIFLTRGQSYIIQSNRLTLIESIGCGKVQLEATNPMTWFTSWVKRRLAIIQMVRTAEKLVFSKI